MESIRDIKKTSQISTFGYVLGLLGFYFQQGAVFGYCWLASSGQPLPNPSGNPFEFFTNPDGIFSGNKSLVQTTIAFFILATIFTFFSFIIEKAGNSVKNRLFGDNKALMVTGILWVVSSFFMIIAMACYTSWFEKLNAKPNANYGWSFAFGWTASGLQLIAGLVYLAAGARN